MALLDDDSPVVQTALRTELLRLKDLGTDLLRRLVNGPNRLLAEHARQYLEEIEGPDPVECFRRFIRSLEYELETGCLLLNRTVNPSLETAECGMLLDAIAARSRELLVLPAPAWEQCRILNRVIFHEFGFRGNREHFDDPLNTMIGPVLQRRKGSPVMLSTIYILVAQRVGLQLEPVGTPGPFLVGCFLDSHPFYIDPFESGGFRSVEEMREILLSHNIAPRASHFAPSPVGEVLCRCCGLLARQYSILNHPTRPRLFASFVSQFEETYRRQTQF